MTLYRRVARPMLFRLEAERAHTATIAALKRLPASAARAHDPRLAVAAFGLRFANPLGLAAGFDKHAEAVDPLLRLGFGFIEIGTVTPLPQAGNPRPRVFRLTRDAAVVNRLGFNSDGHAKVARRLERRSARGGIVGVNLGANKDSGDRMRDYARGLEAFASVASYFTLNVSSPNTPGLRDLQRSEPLAALISCVLETRERLAAKHGAKPVLLKIAPDLTLAELDQIVRVARDLRIDGMIVSNTTLARPPSLKERGLADEAGGLSGRPLFEPSTRFLGQAFLRVERAFPLIGVDGVESAATAWAKIEAGASLLQLYSAMAFEGPLLPRRILAGLVTRLNQSSLAEAVGSRAGAIAAGQSLL